ncbi:MAG: Ig-like domain-containing protein [Lachnospiraceae bacterium]|nr:Ig-like domain-containing protein [Lachnospiraceae bacterium]
MRKLSLKKCMFKIAVLMLTMVFLLEIPSAYVKADETTDTATGFNYTEKTIYAGKSFQLVLNNAPTKIKWWASADESIATVSKKGVVKGVSAGKVKIKAKCNDVKYTCVVTVKDPYVSVPKNYLMIGDTMTAILKGAKIKGYYSSAPNYISVDEKTGVITALKKGTATITAKAKDGRLFKVTVTSYENISVIENPTFDDLAPTTHMTFEELVGDTGERGYPEAMPVPDTYKIIVDLYWKVVMVYARDENGEYTKPVRYMLCSPGASKSPTRTGTFEMKGTRVRFARFKGLTVSAQYWSLIVSATYFHSILYNSNNAKDYTSSYNNLGSAVSHGCIRLTVPDARWIYYNAAPGTVVTIRSGSKNDEETKAIREQFELAKMPSTRPDLKAGEIPWTDNWTIEDVPQDYPYVYVPQ